MRVRLESGSLFRECNAKYYKYGNNTASVQTVADSVTSHMCGWEGGPAGRGRMAESREV